jgi:2-polyprenyl-3-methyl-5-hydroxy-6-metoxy-1,4-benzoquinol methylase
MKQWIRNIIFNKNTAKFWLKLFVCLHNFSYQKISRLVVIENGGVHPKHKLMDYHKFFVHNVTSNDRVLDVGCGNGDVAFDVAGVAEKVVGIDIEQKNIETAKKRHQKPNLEFIAGDATEHEFEEKFDVVILSNVLEHIENRTEFLQKLQKVAPKFLVRVPLITRSWLALYLREKGMEYKLDRTHFIEYREQEIFDELEKAGLEAQSHEARWGEIYIVAIKKQDA